MNVSETHRLAQQIASELGREWVYIPSANKLSDGTPHIWVHITRTTDQAEISMHSFEERGRERMEICGHFPSDWRKVSYPDPLPPKITVDANRSAESIAKAINSRLMNKLDAWHTVQRTRWEHAYKYEKTNQNSLDKLADLLGMELREEDRRSRRVYFHGSVFEIHGNDVNVKFSCSIDYALQLAKDLLEQAKREVA